MSDLVCCMCHPPRPEDIDPRTTVYRCPEHQRHYDLQVARMMLLRMLQPAPPPSRPIIITGI